MCCPCETFRPRSLAQNFHSEVAQSEGTLRVPQDQKPAQSPGVSSVELSPRPAVSPAPAWPI